MGEQRRKQVAAAAGTAKVPWWGSEREPLAIAMFAVSDRTKIPSIPAPKNIIVLQQRQVVRTQVLL